MSFITDYLEVFILSIILLIALGIITFIAMSMRYTALRKDYTAMLKGSNTPDLEQVMIKVHENIEQLQALLAQETSRIDRLLSEMKTLKANVGIHRYNAYDQQGSDLSFSIAIVDEFSSGIVLTGLHSREQTYVYAKALKEGTSDYALSPEEKIAINQAVSKGKS